MLRDLEKRIREIRIFFIIVLIDMNILLQNQLKLVRENSAHFVILDLHMNITNMLILVDLSVQHAIMEIIK